MNYGFDLMEDIKSIQTKIHPLHADWYKNASKDPKLLIRNRPKNQIKVLTTNIQNMPSLIEDTQQKMRIYEIVQSF